MLPIIFLISFMSNLCVFPEWSLGRSNHHSDSSLMSNKSHSFPVLCMLWANPAWDKGMSCNRYLQQLLIQEDSSARWGGQLDSGLQSSASLGVAAPYRLLANNCIDGCLFSRTIAKQRLVYQVVTSMCIYSAFWDTDCRDDVVTFWDMGFTIQGQLAASMWNRLDWLPRI